jgi:hypothetical protein
MAEGAGRRQRAGNGPSCGTDCARWRGNVLGKSGPAPGRANHPRTVGALAFRDRKVLPACIAPAAPRCSALLGVPNHLICSARNIAAIARLADAGAGLRARRPRCPPSCTGVILSRGRVSPFVPSPAGVRPDNRTSRCCPSGQCKRTSSILHASQACRRPEAHQDP